MPIKNGDKVKIEYTGTLEDGTVFDSSERHGSPLEFEVGARHVIKGFENAVMGMEKGEEKSVTLHQEEAYGYHDEQLIKNVPKGKMPDGGEIKPGMLLGLSLPNGAQVPARVVDVTDTEVIIDLNHPLAGKTLNFKIKVIDITD